MPERREQARVNLRCAVALWDPEEGVIVRAATENISCDGFYCVSQRPYRPGARLEAVVEVPDHRAADCRMKDQLWLKCRVHVVRIESIGAGPEFGVAFQIDGYMLATGTGKSELFAFD